MMSRLSLMLRCWGAAFAKATLCPMGDFCKPQTDFCKPRWPDTVAQPLELLLCTYRGCCKAGTATLMLTSNSEMALLTLQLSSGMQKFHGCCMNNRSSHFHVPVHKGSQAGSRVGAIAPHRSSYWAAASTGRLLGSQGTSLWALSWPGCLLLSLSPPAATTPPHAPPPTKSKKTRCQLWHRSMGYLHLWCGPSRVVKGLSQLMWAQDL